MVKFLNYLIIKKKLLLTFPFVFLTIILSQDKVKKIAYSLSANLKRRFSKKLNRFNFSNNKKNGVNIVGYALYDSGYGEHCRGLIKATEGRGINFDVFNFDFKYNELEYSNTEQFQKYIKNKLAYDATIFALNPYIANKFFKKNSLSKYDSLKMAAGYNIAYGFWEMPKLPKKWVNIASKFDEIWAPTRFVQDAFSKNTIAPTIHMPLAIDFKLGKKYNRADYNLPSDKFLFLFSFDIIGYDNRKNPKAVIEAFKLAFHETNKDVALVLKIVDHGDKDNSVRISRFRQLIDLPEHQVYFIDKNFKKDEVLGLFSVCDSYVSLHRCEGFGMGIAESMKLGKPVIVTNYSGNLDFNNSTNSCLVDYKLVEVKKENYPLIDDVDIWAEADIESAAKYMQRIYNDSEFRQQIALMGKKTIDEQHNMNIIGSLYEQRLKKLGLIR